MLVMPQTRLFCVIFLLSSHISAEAAPCREIKDDKDRLSCFDQLEKDKLGSNISNWNSGELTSQLDKSKIPHVSSVSVSANIFKFPRPGMKARLVIMCKEKKTDLYIEFPDRVAFNMRGFSAQYRSGDTKPVNAIWSSSQDGRAYGPFDSSSTIPLIKSIISSDDFYVRGEDDLAGTSDAYFKTSGLGEAIKPIREACKW